MVPISSSKPDKEQQLSAVLGAAMKKNSILLASLLALCALEGVSGQSYADLTITQIGT
jgi:hypothetical protein